MNETLFIPKTIKVGFNYREDTYTKKLAYVIYYDDKGKLRKENSWSNWIQRPGKEISFYNDVKRTWDKQELDSSFEPKDFDNVPMSGFVLNKGVGGARQSWGWNARNEYIRVFDPRGFEFEISVINLLFILTECTSSKGKGLEGEFVYSWAGKELVLLPVDSLEYKESKKYTDLQDKKITKNDMIPGRVYQFKNKTVATYLGRLSYHEFNYYGSSEAKLKHIFKTESGNYLAESGFTKLALIINENVDDTYADLLQEYQDSKYYNPKIKEIFIDNINNRPELIKTKDNEYKYITYHSGNTFHTNQVYLNYNDKIYLMVINSYDGSVERLIRRSLNNGKIDNVEIYKCPYWNNSSVGLPVLKEILDSLKVEYVKDNNRIKILNPLNFYTYNELYVVLEESGTVLPVSDYTRYY